MECEARSYSIPLALIERARLLYFRIHGAEIALIERSTEKRIIFNMEVISTYGQ